MGREFQSFLHASNFRETDVGSILVEAISVCSLLRLKLTYHKGEQVKHKDGRHQVQIDLADKLLLSNRINRMVDLVCLFVMKFQWNMFTIVEHIGEVRHVDGEK